MRNPGVSVEAGSGAATELPKKSEFHDRFTIMPDLEENGTRVAL